MRIRIGTPEITDLLFVFIYSLLLRFRPSLIEAFELCWEAVAKLYSKTLSVQYAFIVSKYEDNVLQTKSSLQFDTSFFFSSFFVCIISMQLMIGMAGG